MELTRETIIGLLPKHSFTTSNIPTGRYEYEYEDDRMAIYLHLTTGKLYNIKKSDFKHLFFRGKPMLWSVRLKDRYQFVSSFTVTEVELTGQYPISAHADFVKYIDKIEAGKKLSRQELNKIYTSEIIAPDHELRRVHIDVPVII